MMDATVKSGNDAAMTHEAMTLIESTLLNNVTGGVTTDGEADASVVKSRSQPYCVVWDSDFCGA